MSWAYLLVSIVGEVIATTMMKLSEGFSKPIPSIITAVGYGIAFYFLSLALKSIPVSVAYAIWAGAGIVLISAIGYFYFKQSFDFPGIVGIILILAGVATINIFSKMVNH